jgi:hypothetical protein
VSTYSGLVYQKVIALPSAHEATALDHLAEYSPNATRLASEWQEHGDDAVHGLVWNGLAGTTVRRLLHTL